MERDRKRHFSDTVILFKIFHNLGISNRSSEQEIGCRIFLFVWKRSLLC